MGGSYKDAEEGGREILTRRRGLWFLTERRRWLSNSFSGKRGLG